MAYAFYTSISPGKGNNKIMDTNLRGGEESLVTLRRLRDGKNIVIKIASNAKTEAMIMRLARKHGVPVPRIHELRGDKLYMEWIPGREPTESDANKKLIGQFAKIMRKLHSVNVSRIGDPSSPKANSPAAWKSFLKRRFETNLKILQSTKHADAKMRHALEKTFEALAREGIRPFKPSIVHGDLHLYNVRLSANGKLILFDFNNAFFGDPLYDFAPFKYFCPRHFTSLRKAYSKKIFPLEKDAFRFYFFLQTVDAAAFYAHIQYEKRAKHALRLLRQEVSKVR